MSARVFSAGQGVDQLPIDNVNYEENETNNNETPSGAGESKPTNTRRNPMKKRASVQSNLSRVSSNGQLCSNPNSGSSQAGDQEEEEEGDANDLGGQQQMSNEEYERIRNTTLLFFLDRLCLASHEGKEARTLHDLSCLFGTREFTKEMRQIVGASRNGLKKFLQSYPSLFQIEDDKVYLTQLNGGAGSQVTKRDYNGEAVDYFKQKLLQFGSSLVPIKNLFGYRSQASQEVRHVSGKNSRDFKRFLKQNDDVFEILADEHVVLRSALRELESQGMSSLSLQQSLQPVPADEATTLDPYLNKQLAHLIEDCIRRLMSEQQPPVQEDQFRVTLEKLYEIIREQCQNELFLKMVKSLEDLKVFLRMHPKLFKRIPLERANEQQKQGQGQESQSDKDQAIGNPLNGVGACYYVGLVSESERREQELLAFRATNLLARQLSTPGTQNTSTDSVCAETKTDGEAQSSKSVETIQKEANSSSVQAVSVSSSSSSNINNNNKQHEEPTSNNKRLQHPLQASLSVDSKSRPFSSNQTASHRLRANAPPFVPSVRTQTNQRLVQHQSGTKQSQMMVQRQSSLLNQGYRSQRAPNDHQPDARTQMRPEPVQRSVSNLSSPLRSLTDGGGNYHEPAPARDLPPSERRPAIRGHMGEQQNNNWAQQQQQQQTLPRHPKSQPLSLEAQLAGQRSNSTTSNSASLAGQEDLRARTVDIVREASNIISKIMTTTDAVAFDCKGYNLGFDGKITLIQFGFLPQKNFDPMQLANSMNKRFASTAPTLTTANRDTNGVGDKEKVANGLEKAADNSSGANKEIKPEVCVFDLITNPELAYCLKPLLESDKIVKIVHDVRNKSNALHVQFNITLNNVFDTQVANLVIQQQITGKPAYKSRYISMGKLCEVYGGENLVKYRDMIRIKTSSRGGGSSISRQANNSMGSSSTSSASSKDVNYWRSRPLTRAMVLEATMDVYCLIGGIYQNLNGQIKPEYKPLFDLLNLEGVLARIKPDEIRSAKKERKIDMEVIDLKRKLYSDSTGPVVLSNREIRLLRHIDLTEGVRQKIQQCKKVAKKIERLDMKAALLAQQQSETGEPNSLASPGSNNSGTNGTDGAGEGGQVDGLDQRQEQLQARLDEFNAAVKMMEDNSMFDEFKERLNESTSLLESLEDDDDDDDDDEAAVQLSSGHHSHNGSSINDCCRCQCHSNQNSLESGASLQQPGKATAISREKQPEPAATSERLEPDASKCQEEVNSESNSECIINGSGRKIGDNHCSSTPIDDSKQSDSRDEPKDEVVPIKQKEDEVNSLTGSENSDDSKSSACDMAVQCDLLS